MDRSLVEATVNRGDFFLSTRTQRGQVAERTGTLHK